LEHAFDAAGYAEWSFYWIPGGFALVSRIERIGADASPLSGPARWSVSMQKSRVATLDQYIKALFNAPPGHYRVIVFVVTDKSFSATRQEPTSQEATDWLTAGAMKLPAQIGHQPYTSDHYASALIYEFERSPDAQQAMAKRPSDSLGRTHLEKAGLWSALEAR
jgi:hypothetical protein